MLATIENLLEKSQDTREWRTIRKILSTHMRNTIIINDKDGNILHVRVSGQPEDEHEEIYSKLGVRNPLTTITHKVEK